MDVRLLDAELREQALSFLERPGVEPCFDFGVQRVLERWRLEPE